jgi:very-short-patch-repair endonuclease
MQQFKVGETVEGCGFLEATDRNGMRALVMAVSPGVYDLMWVDGHRDWYVTMNVRKPVAKPKPRVPSHIEETFALHCRVNKLTPIREHRFHPERGWKFDFCWPEKKVAVECEGGIWTNGRHTRGAGAREDMDKYNSATALGWHVFRFDAEAVKSGHAIKFVTDFFGDKHVG